MANVYAIGFPSGKLYIGLTSKTVAQRLTAHLKDTRAGSKLPVHSALRKYGRNVQLVVLAQGVSFDEAKDLEIWWISGLATMAPNGYNLTAGGDGLVGCRPTAETRLKMSKAHTGYKHTAEAKEKNRKASIGNQNCLGHRQTSEHKEKTRKAVTGRKHTAEHIEKNRKAATGYRHTAEAKEKNRKANTGCKDTAETTKKRKESQIRRRLRERNDPTGL